MANKGESQMSQPIRKECFLDTRQDLHHETTTFNFAVLRNKELEYYHSIYSTEFDDLESDVYTLLYCIREDISEDIEDKVLFDRYSSGTKELFYQIFLHLSNQETLQAEGFDKKETQAFIEGLIKIFHEYPELYLYFE